MHLDFEDYRPETPSVPSAITRREGVLLSLVMHLVLVIAYLMTPEGFLQRSAPVYPVRPSQDPVRFVSMAPAVDRTAVPAKPLVMSDIDRRSATRERPADAQNQEAFSRGNTPERVEGAPAERAAGPDSPGDAMRATPPPPSATPIPSLAVPQPPDTGGGLGKSLRNLQRYLKDDNFANQKGGLPEQDAIISFDSKGVDFGWWIRRFLAQVKTNWRVPDNVMMINGSGRVVIQFVVHKNGIISDVKIVAPNAVVPYNTLAEAALRTSNPTTPLPPEFPDERMPITLTFLYIVGPIR